jgi:hypothetical protein
VHHRIEWALRWADPWNERIWEVPSDADESAVLLSTRKKPGVLLANGLGDTARLTLHWTLEKERKLLGLF